MGTRCRAVFAASAFVWLSGCADGPNYELPALGIPKFFGTATLTSAVAGPPTAADFVRWWQNLRDRQLTAFVDRAVASNPDIEIALDRVIQRGDHLVDGRAVLGFVGPETRGED